MADTVQAEQAVENALVRRCQGNDLAAFDQIVERYQDRIYTFVRRMVRDGGEAEDVAQEVFVKAFQAIRQFDGRASLSTWLFRIASNLCVDHARRRARRIDPLSLSGATDEERETDVPDRRYDPERMVIEDEMRRIVDKVVGGLSEKLRTVLLLHDMQNLSYEEIAEVVKVPLGTVKSRLFLARSQVRDAMRDYLRGAEAR